MTLAIFPFVWGAQEAANPLRYEYRQDGVVFSVTPRTPEQVAAFYEGRRFSPEVIQALTEVCLLTITITNRHQDIVWLEPERWRFWDQHGPVTRLNRGHWNALWEKLVVPLAHRATFGWTQLPEVSDLHPSEPVGGNVTVIPPSGSFILEARFQTGVDKRGKEIVIRVADLLCPGRDALAKPR